MVITVVSSQGPEDRKYKKGIIIANVVPEITFNLVTLCERYFEIRPMIVGDPEVDLGIDIDTIQKKLELTALLML